jgi:Ran-binding protein 1
MAAVVEEKDVSGVEEKATPSVAPTAAEETAEEPGKHGDEEDTGAQIAPIVKLEEVVISTGEENEDVLLDIKAKLYRFDKEGTQWKERGVGQVKLLEHKQTKKVRLLMRQSRTLKICANHMGEFSWSRRIDATSQFIFLGPTIDFPEYLSPQEQSKTMQLMQYRCWF